MVNQFRKYRYRLYKSKFLFCYHEIGYKFSFLRLFIDNILAGNEITTSPFILFKLMICYIYSCLYFYMFTHYLFRILFCVFLLLISYYNSWYILRFVCNVLNMQRRNTPRAINDHYNCIPINTDYFYFSPISTF